MKPTLIRMLSCASLLWASTTPTALAAPGDPADLIGEATVVVDALEFDPALTTRPRVFVVRVRDRQPTFGAPPPIGSGSVQATIWLQSQTIALPDHGRWYCRGELTFSGPTVVLPADDAPAPPPGSPPPGSPPPAPGPGDDDGVSNPDPLDQGDPAYPDCPEVWGVIDAFNGELLSLAEVNLLLSLSPTYMGIQTRIPSPHSPAVYAYAWQSTDSGQVLLTINDYYGWTFGMSSFLDTFFPVSAVGPFTDLYSLQTVGLSYPSCDLETHGVSGVGPWDDGPVVPYVPGASQRSVVALDHSFYSAATDTYSNTTRTTVGVGLHHRCSATFTNADLETPHYAP